MVPEQLPPNVMVAKCPSRQVLDLIADKWSVIIIYALARQQPLRRGELHRKVDGISAKVLTQVLRALAQNGLVHRKVFDVLPPAVEYSLTPLGQTLVEPLAALATWAEQHMAEVVAARLNSMPK